MKHLRKWIHLLALIGVMLCLTGCGALFGVQIDGGNQIQEIAEEQREAREEAENDTEESEVPVDDEEITSSEEELDDKTESPADEKSPEVEEQEAENTSEEMLLEDGSYTTKEEVALYLHQYGHLPSNFITKKEAEKLGWEGGSLEPYAPGMCIGGSRFGNYEGLLPEKEGRSYTECDIDTLGADRRGAKRIVFSNDGLIYYTEDHYETFELLYGEES